MGAFVARYGPQIHDQCRHWKLQPADAEDITQMVLLRVTRSMPGFQYDPSRSLRGWLHTLTRNARSDLLTDQARAVMTPVSLAVNGLLRTPEAWDELADRLQQVYKQELLELAMDRVQKRVEPHTWEAFRLTAIEHVPAADVATKLGITLAVVYRARSVVQGMLRQEVQLLDPEPEAVQS